MALVSAVHPPITLAMHSIPIIRPVHIIADELQKKDRLHHLFVLRCGKPVGDGTRFSSVWYDSGKLSVKRSPRRQTIRLFGPLSCVLGLAHPQARVIGCEPISAVYCLRLYSPNSANSVQIGRNLHLVKSRTLDFAQPFNHKGKERHEYENDQESFSIDIAH